MPHRDLIVVGASAGGVEALRELMRDLPADLPAAMVVVLHLPATAFSALPNILDRVSTFPVRAATQGAPLVEGEALVAPPDHHLLIRHDHVVLGAGPKENGHRPAIDPLLRSAARWRGPRAIGVILSGTLDDGASGLLTIAQRGGATVVQDPETAHYSGMPNAALRAVPESHVASGPALAKLLWELCNEPLPEGAPPADNELVIETDIAALDEAALGDPNRPGTPAAMTCPDCNGAMFAVEGDVLRYRCRVGHAWSPESLLHGQVEATEAALWAGVRSLEEKAALHRRLAAHNTSRHPHTARHHEERAAEVEAAAAAIRALLRDSVIRAELSPAAEVAFGD